MSVEKNSRAPRILISGGGTGGHIFPALAIAEAVKRACPDAEFLFVGAEGRMEMERVPAAGYRIIGLPVAGFDRKRLWRNFGVLRKLFISMRRARNILNEFQPDVAVGVGGYASGPMLKAAQKRGIPTLLQEQNSYAGVTNKLLGGKASRICVAYDKMERFFPAEKIVVTGNPVRKNLTEQLPEPTQARRDLGFSNPDAPLVVVTGGSLGARTINRSMANALPKLEKMGCNILWQTGKLYYSEYSTMSVDGKVKVVEFISDMKQAYAAATIVVARAGASTISELQLLGKAAILVPSPNVAENHQYKNAMALVERNAALLVTDDDAPQQLGDAIVTLIGDPARCDEMAANAAAMSHLNSDDVIAGYVLQLANQYIEQKCRE